MSADSNDTRRDDVVVKIDGEENDSSNNGDGGKFWRESSYNFWHGDQKDKNGKPAGGQDDGSFDFMQRRNEKKTETDPPSKLIPVSRQTKSFRRRNLSRHGTEHA